MHAASN